MKERFNSQYLNQKLEPESKSLLRENSENANIANYKELGEHSYDSESSKFEFLIGQTKITLSYSKPVISDLVNEKDFASRLFTASGLTNDDLLDFDNLKKKLGLIIDNIRCVDELILENQDSKYEVKEFFNNGKIFFNLHKNTDVSSCINLEDKQIFLSEDPLTPEGIVSLFHELGHYKDSTRIESPTKPSHKSRMFIARTFKGVALNADQGELKDKVWEMGARDLLTLERDAWAIALNDLKPFIKDLKLKRSDLENYVHGKCLLSYSEFIRRVIA